MLYVCLTSWFSIYSLLSGLAAHFKSLLLLCRNEECLLSWLSEVLKVLMVMFMVSVSQNIQTHALCLFWPSKFQLKSYSSACMIHFGGRFFCIKTIFAGSHGLFERVQNGPSPNLWLLSFKWNICSHMSVWPSLLDQISVFLALPPLLLATFTSQKSRKLQSMAFEFSRIRAWGPWRLSFKSNPSRYMFVRLLHFLK